MTATISAPKRTTAAPRHIYHPTQKDYATFLETSAQTGGKHTLIEIEVAPGGGTVPHYHLAYSERFEVLEGELEVHLGPHPRQGRRQPVSAGLERRPRVDELCDLGGAAATLQSA
jgi:mannose-6-phosphate isomerase-like protein (cupin superfamily)